jgi:hypothetical protein
MIVILGGVMFIVLSIGPKVCRFKPGQGQWIFKGDKFVPLLALEEK